jgi:AraC-like DNA-binding protein
MPQASIGERSETSETGDNGWSQRVGGLTEIPGLLWQFGADPAQVLSKVGLAADALDNAENRIPFTAADRLLGACVAATGCAHFGLLVGSRWGLSYFGALGELMRHSGTVGEALGHMAVYQRLNSDAGAAFFHQHEATVSFGYAIYRKDVRHPDQIYDVAMAIVCNLMRALCGPRWSASEVVFSRHEPADQTPYRRHFSAPLHFDQDRSAVRFPAHWQERAIPGADPERRRTLATVLDAAGSASLVSDLNRSLRLLLLAGKSSGDELAQILSLHRRTLNRRLQAQGTTFRKVLDDVRFEVARHLLEHTRAPINEIAAALCYAEVSAFMHAFRRWSGTTPAQWRKTAGKR